MTERVSEQQRQALKMAAGWYATFCAGDTTAQQHARWQQWLQQHEDHRWAWQRVESLQNQLQTLPGHLGYQTLNQAHLTRRRVLKSLLVLLGVGSGWQLWQSPLGLSLRADYSTGTGEMRSVRLSDGSQMTLNTASAVQVEFTGSQRTVHLQRGEIAITTAADAQQRPFRVATADGVLRALGTEFSVRLWPHATELSVQQHAVEVTLADESQQKQVVQQGQTLRFGRSAFGELLPLAADSSSWTRGLLSVSNRPLGEVIAEVARYRHGMLICDDSAADLRVSGTFPLQDTDRLLAVLAQTLPIKIQTASRYWVKVSAA
ncbi:ferric citrate uptake sigma factor regulator FecR [Erwinia sp. JUb26]|uniref:ferric citrate uptake sigma factor regulator FecR n=1 Tax=Erwinia sp. JUb26 TaxID=2485126 RepID=UPI000F46A50B|nr:ferric citrate uptake sigma factor regulator FecR [Erwinia sp. JUb26]ROR13358.1 FecR family protein [Erwinia sp. JUb26]